MASFFIIISFIIQLLLVVIIYILYRQIQQIKKQDYQEINEILTAFLREMKETSNPLPVDDKYEEKDPQMHPINEEVNILKLAEDKNTVVSTSIEGQVLQLYEQGVAIDEIARKLEKGKTEIELIIKLRRDKQTSCNS